MAEDWASDVKRYHPEADDEVIAGIVRYCGIALRNRDSQLVSFRDATESARVRDNFLRKKLGLTHPDSDLDSAIAAVGERMQGDATKSRVTVYYLLSDRFAAHDRFRKKAPVKAAKTSAAAAPVAAAPTVKRAKTPAAAKPARPAAARERTAPRGQAAVAAAPASAPAAPAGLASSLPGASSDAGEKLGFGHYQTGKHGDAGAGWLWGALAVAAILLVLGLIA